MCDLTTDVEEPLLRQRFGKHVSASLLANVSVKGMALLLVKILTVILPKDEYGVYSLWMAFILLMTTMSTRAYTASIWRFMPRERSSADKKGASQLLTAGFAGTFAFLSPMVAILVVSGLAGFQLIEDPSYAFTITIVTILVSLSVMKELILVISGSEQNSREILGFNLLYGASSSLIAALFVLVYGTYRLALAGLCIGYTIPIFVTFLIKVRQYGLAFPEKAYFLGILRFGLPSILIGSVVNFVPFAASLLVGYWVGLQDVANLAIAFSIASIFSFAVGPFLGAYQAYIVNAYETDNYEEGNRVSRRLAEIFIALSFPALWLMISISPWLIELISTILYLDATELVYFTVAATALLSISQLWKVQLDLAEKPHLTGIIYLASAIGFLATCFLFLPIIGTLGVGIALLIQAGIVLTILYRVANRVLPLRPSRKFLAATSAGVSLSMLSFIILWLLEFQQIVLVLAPVLLYLLILERGQIINIRGMKEILGLLTGR